MPAMPAKSGLVAIAVFLASTAGALACDDFDEEMAMAAAQRAVHATAVASDVVGAQQASSQPLAGGLASSDVGSEKEAQNAALGPSPVLRR